MAAAEETPVIYEENWGEETSSKADPIDGVDCQDTKNLYEAFKTRRTLNGRKPRQWLIAYPRQHEKYFFHELGPELTEDMEDSTAVAQVVERMLQLGQGLKNDSEPLDDETHKFTARNRKRQPKVKPSLGYVHWRDNNQIVCIDYCSDSFPATIKFMHPQGGKDFKEAYKSSSGVNDQHFKYNSESALTAEIVINSVSAIQNN